MELFIIGGIAALIALLPKKKLAPSTDEGNVVVKPLPTKPKGEWNILPYVPGVTQNLKTTGVYLPKNSAETVTIKGKIGGNTPSKNLIDEVTQGNERYFEPVKREVRIAREV